MFSGQARHQHRRLAGDGDLVVAVMILQRCGHRQSLLGQMPQQCQIGGQCVVVQGFEDSQYQRGGLLMTVLSLNQEGAVLDAMAGRPECQ